MKEIVRKIILCISVIVFVYSAYQLITIYLDYKSLSESTEELVEEFIMPVEKIEIEKEEEKEETVEDIVNTEDPYGRTVNFEGLKKVNEDVIGWIYIPGTKIDEPVLKGENNDTYLRTSIYKNYLFAGQIFIDEDNSSDFNDVKTIIYGHNMTNGSRFGQVSKFTKKAFFDEHPYIYIYKPDGTMYVYEIFVSRVLETSSPLFYQVNDYNDFVKQIQNGASQVRTVSEEESPIIFLSTCVNSDLSKRYMIAARLSDVIKH